MSVKTLADLTAIEIGQTTGQSVMMRYSEGLLDWCMRRWCREALTFCRNCLQRLYEASSTRLFCALDAARSAMPRACAVLQQSARSTLVLICAVGKVEAGSKCFPSQGELKAELFGNLVVNPRTGSTIQGSAPHSVQKPAALSTGTCAPERMPLLSSAS